MTRIAFTFIVWIAACGPGGYTDGDTCEYAHGESTDGEDGDGESCDHIECNSGTCDEGLVCTLGEVCALCPAGWPGCPCGEDGHCEAGQCSAGTDADGGQWSICYPADLISCRTEPCPGDAHCTDEFECAWSD